MLMRTSARAPVVAFRRGGKKGPRTMKISKKLAVFMAALAGVFMLTACADSADQAGGGAGGAGGDKIRIALDWTPNTNHTGLYVAINKGYFKDAGLDVEILPYNDSNPDLMVDAGQAEFGVSFQDTATITMAAGADVRSVLAVQQTWSTEVSVLADRDEIKSPADLDGLTYGGFANPSEEATMRGVIQAAGGKGEIETVTLGTSAYEALYNGDVDFTVPFVAWEGIEAADRGVELKNFAYTDYGFPDCYNMIILGNGTWLENNPEDAKKFVQALQRGYQDSVDDPDGAAQILHEENPDLLTDVEFLKRSQRMLAEKYMVDEEGKFGRQTEEHWAELGKFLGEQGLLVDANNKPLTEDPDWSAYFTNEYLAD